MARVVKRVLLGTLAVMLTVAGCNLSTRAFGWSAPSGISAMTAVDSVGHLGNPAIGESSGLTPSASQAGRFWTLNDSGNEPELFAIDSAGRALRQLRVTGVSNEDWEALSAGPCARGTCLYIGDVGDNFARRDHVTIWRVVEPERAAGTVPVDARLDVRYADGARDVEAMFVAPDTSLWFITKRPWRRWIPTPDPVRLYRVPASAWQQRSAMVTAQRVGTLPIVPGHFSARDWVTDAALSPVQPDGARRLAVLTYGVVHVFAADAATGRPGALLGRCALTFPERDSEAIAWLPNGTLLITNEGTGSRVYAGRCP